MHNDFFIKSKKSLKILFGTLFWIGVLMTLSSLSLIYSPPTDETSASEGQVFALIFFALLTFISGALWNLGSRKAQVQGDLVTFTHGLIRPKSWTIDLANVTRIATTPPYGTRTDNSILLLAPHEGPGQKFSLEFYKQEDRERFLPIITELLNRPGITLEGEHFEQVLRSWFEDKAPALTSPVSPHRTIPRPKASGIRLFLTWASCVITVVLLPAVVGGYILSSKADERALDQRGQQTVAAIESKRHSYRSRSAGAYSLVVTHTVSQSQPAKAWVYVTSEYYHQANVGETVDIMYDPQNPTRARLADARYAKPYWESVRRTALWIAPVYIIMVIVAVLMLRKERKNAW